MTQCDTGLMSACCLATWTSEVANFADAALRVGLMLVEWAACCMHARHCAGCNHPQQPEVQEVAMAAAQVSGRVTVWSRSCSRRGRKLPQLRSHVCYPNAMLSPAALPAAGVVWISSLHAATQAAVSANLRELGLRSAVAQQDLRGHQAAQQQQQATALELDYRQPPVPRPQNRKLDIVMAYTSGQSTQETVRVWRQVGVARHTAVMRQSGERSQQVMSPLHIVPPLGAKTGGWLGATGSWGPAEGCLTPDERGAEHWRDCVGCGGK